MTSPDLSPADLLAPLLAAIPQWLPRQRWFGAKSHIIRSANTTQLIPMQSGAICLVTVDCEGAPPETYQLPLAIAAGTNAQRIIQSSPDSVIVQQHTADGPIILYDATASEEWRHELLALIAEADTLSGDNGARLISTRTTAVPRSSSPSRLRSTEQSNTSIEYGSQTILKLFRRIQPGINPDVEIARYLTGTAHFPQTPPLLGEITLRSGAESTTLAVLHRFVPNQGDGWSWTLQHLADPGYQPAAALLGRRTAELHLALASANTLEAFHPEPITASDLATEALRMAESVDSALDLLRAKLPHHQTAAIILSNRTRLLAAVQAISAAPPSGQRIRIHGDYHLGQLLRTADDWMILDFEGEPARSRAERRRKQSPLKDVAGMLRSFAYAAARGFDDPTHALQWQTTISNAFLAAYGSAIAHRPELLPTPQLAEPLLNAYLLQKALYELTYELNNRPQWAPVPLAGILDLLRHQGPRLAHVY